MAHITAVAVNDSTALMCEDVAHLAVPNSTCQFVGVQQAVEQVPIKVKTYPDVLTCQDVSQLVLYDLLSNISTTD